MTNVTVDVPQELLDQLGRSPLADLEGSARVRVALAIHLFTSRQVSLGRAAELAGSPLVEFHHLLRSLDLPTVLYDADELAEDLKAIDALERDSRAGSRP